MKSSMLVLTAALLLTATTSCSKNRLRGEGSVISDTRNLSTFKRVESNGSTDVTVVKDSVYKVIVRGYENLVPVYETIVTGDKLKLEFKDKYYNIKNNNVTVEVHTPDIEYLSMNGSGDAVVNSGFDGKSFEGKINGSGGLKVENSTFATFKADINGSGDINASSTVCDNGYANISGSGNIEINVRKFISAHISGSGNVSYWGNPASTDIKVSGSGTVKKKG